VSVFERRWVCERLAYGASGIAGGRWRGFSDLRSFGSFGGGTDHSGRLGDLLDEHVAKLREIVGFIHGQEAFAGVQLAHAGRKASMSRPWVTEHLASAAEGGWPDATVAPSAVAFSDSYPKPLALDTAGILKVKADFVAAARRAQQAKFDVLEVHAAHGYLLHQFLSPLSNLRMDEYGGCYENRTRLLREIVAELRQIWTGPLFVRISATDWAGDRASWTLEDSVVLSRALREMGVDLMDVSSGGLVPGVTPPVGPGIATGAVGMITQAAQADHIIRTGQADLVLLAREMLRDPYWPLHAALALGKDTPSPPQYLRAAKPR